MSSLRVGANQRPSLTPYLPSFLLTHADKGDSRVGKTGLASRADLREREERVRAVETEDVGTEIGPRERQRASQLEFEGSSERRAYQVVTTALWSG